MDDKAKKLLLGETPGENAPIDKTSDAAVFASEMIRDCYGAGQSPDEVYGKEVSDRLRKYVPIEKQAHIWYEGPEYEDEDEDQ